MVSAQLLLLLCLVKLQGCLCWVFLGFITFAGQCCSLVALLLELACMVFMENIDKRFWLLLFAILGYYVVVYFMDCAFKASG